MTIVVDPLEPAVSTSTFQDEALERLEPRFRLSWLDPALYTAPQGVGTQAYQRQRDFKHLGGAITWARRRIFHGAAFGDTMELSRVERSRVNGLYQEDIDEVQDVTLAGFYPWERLEQWNSSHRGILRGQLNKRCFWG